MSRRSGFFIFYLLFFIASCRSESVKSEISNPETGKKVSIKNSDSLRSPVDSLIISKSLFEQLVARMDSLGYNPDTTYFDEKMYQDGSIHYSNYETNYVHEILINKGNYGDLTERAYLKEYDLNFSKVKDIRIYPWRMADTLGKRRNGEVQNWVFENKKDARYVFDFLEYEKLNNGFPFINTESYYFQCENEIFIFNAFKNDVSTHQFQFYDWIRKQCQTRKK